MFKRLQQKWKVSAGRLVLILTTFAIAGSCTGYAGRKVLSLAAIESQVVYIILYIIIVTLLWPLMILLISIPMGEFYFFRNYMSKLGKKLTRR